MTAPAAAEEFVTVLQGNYEISADPRVRLTTILGSCVAVCLYDETARVGGMNHYLLPVGRDDGTQSLRYGVHAMELLINGLLRTGARRSGLRAKIFGGASMSAGHAAIGLENGRWGREFLINEGFPIMAESLGGTKARRLVMTPATGHVRQMIVAPVELPRSEMPGAVPMQPRKKAVTLF